MLLSTLSGCAPEASPTPAPTAAFASEAEAFAAAEEVYRAYIEAGNARRNGDAAANPQDYLVGTALKDAIDGQNYLRERGIRLAGQIGVASFTGETAPQPDSPIVSAFVCVDISASRALDASGNDVTPPERPLIVAQQVTFIHDGAELRISKETEGDATSCSSL